MEVSVLLDSVILIDHLNGIAAATRYLGSMGGASVSVITRAEVLAGVSAKDASPVLRLLDRFPTLPIDRAAADLAAELRRQYRWRLPDAFQAALAQLHGLKLATRNTRDFPPQQHAFVVVPYSV
jgi:predicted nucleic acid-binding protein